MSGAQSLIADYLRTRQQQPTGANISSVLSSLATNPDLVPGLRAAEPISSYGDPGVAGPPTQPQPRRPVTAVTRGGSQQGSVGALNEVAQPPKLPSTPLSAALDKAAQPKQQQQTPQQPAATQPNAQPNKPAQQASQPNAQPTAPVRPTAGIASDVAPPLNLRALTMPTPTPGGPNPDASGGDNPGNPANAALNTQMGARPLLFPRQEAPEMPANPNILGELIRGAATYGADDPRFALDTPQKIAEAKAAGMRNAVTTLGMAGGAPNWSAIVNAVRSRLGGVVPPQPVPPPVTPAAPIVPQTGAMPTPWQAGRQPTPPQAQPQPVVPPVGAKPSPWQAAPPPQPPPVEPPTNPFNIPADVPQPAPVRVPPEPVNTTGASTQVTQPGALPTQPITPTVTGGTTSATGMPPSTIPVRPTVPMPQPAIDPIDLSNISLGNTTMPGAVAPNSLIPQPMPTIVVRPPMEATMPAPAPASPVPVPTSVPNIVDLTGPKPIDIRQGPPPVSAVPKKPREPAKPKTMSQVALERSRASSR